jgi:hypothetical protein
MDENEVKRRNGKRDKKRLARMRKRSEIKKTEKEIGGGRKGLIKVGATIEGCDSSRRGSRRVENIGSIVAKRVMTALVVVGIVEVFEAVSATV